MVGRKKKVPAVPAEEPIDLSARIGVRDDAAAAVPPVRRHDGPIDPATRARILIADPVPVAVQHTAAWSDRPTMIGLEESLAPAPPRVAILDDEPASAPPLISVRAAPAFGEIDLVATPLPTPDDWHHFELALRKLRGIGELRTEYYRAGVLKVRVRWSGVDRFANAVRSVPGYRVRVLGEDRNTVQVLVGRQ